MKAQTREEGSSGRYVVNGTVVRADCIVEIHSDIIKAGRNESHERNEPGRGRRRLGAYGAIRRVRWGCRRQSGG